ncbi:hypothetical protein RZO50_06845 [Microbacterium sp. SSW1-59]|uniref:hypothetical protein n=1 Tax=Microbacterium xanthum TaxID=3079794 RepID=UPI002AD590CC|nr:hypothetical protein [Microbacterium sp. SSW1-59]MDZ8201225.1 hypothetical protein [Microbacterium sp. SSW1-59]
MTTDASHDRHDEHSDAPGTHEGSRGAGSESPEEGEAAMAAAEDATVDDED